MVELEIQNEQQMYESRKPQKLNCRRQTLQTLQQFDACCMLPVKVTDRCILWLHKLTDRITPSPKCWALEMLYETILSFHSSSDGHATCNSRVCISGSHEHEPPFAFVALLPMDFPRKVEVTVWVYQADCCRSYSLDVIRHYRIVIKHLTIDSCYCY